jgi:hypothetical protein
MEMGKVERAVQRRSASVLSNSAAAEAAITATGVAGAEAGLLDRPEMARRGATDRVAPVTGLVPGAEARMVDQRVVPDLST